MPEPIPLVVLSQNWVGEGSVAISDVYQAMLRDGSLVVAGSAMSGGFSSQRRLPSECFALSGVDDYPEWLSVLDWILAMIGSDAVFVVDLDHPLRELMLMGLAARGTRYCLRVTSFGRRSVPPIEYALLNNAECVLLPTSAPEQELSSRYVGPYTPVRSLRQVADLVRSNEAASQSERNDAAGVEVGSFGGRTEEPVRALLVAYYSGPCRTVGVQRVNYWFEQLSEVSGGAVDVHLATAMEWGDVNDRLHVIPDLHAASLLDDEGRSPRWSSDFVATEQQDAASFNTLSFYWRYAVERYFDSAEHEFDVVLISGNPFSCFEFGAYAKRRWHARVILDYRDPFGNNPRFRYTPEARAHARYVERGFNYQADLISVVNDHCVGLVEGGSEAEIRAFPNGFDERVLASVEPAALPADKINIVHAGAFARDRSPVNILRALDPSRHLFHHVGSTAGVDPETLAVGSVVTHGLMPYSGAVGVIGGADIGLVLLSEQNFETPTKLYDYLGMGIDVLLCTNGEPDTGALATALDGIEGVYWCENTEEGVARFLEQYRPSRGRDQPHRSMFSRRHGAELLAAKVVDLARG